jgi:glyoxalase family protein
VKLLIHDDHSKERTTMTTGIHHVTAVSGEISRTLDFYGRVLGLRLIKRTVNYDDPATYHLYFGDELGHPGTILTFFPWPGGSRGRHGLGQAAVTAFLVPEASLGFWIERLVGAGVPYEGPSRRFDEQVLSFADPDGMLLELVARADAPTPAWAAGPVPAEHAIRGFQGVTLWVNGDPGTQRLLTGPLGFQVAAEADGRTRLVGTGAVGSIVDLRQVGGFWRGAGGVGTVHHVAFRAPDDAAQLEARRALDDLDVRVTPVQDRQYFHSIYFREPGGVLFEIATDGPGFTTDESPAELGSGLRLPRWLESDRAAIEQALPPLPALKAEAGHAVR